MSSPSPKIRWPLAVSTFTLWDKLKIGAFLIKEPIWTYGKWVKHYEDMWVKEFGVKHAIMVSSGSAANELIALRRKWELQQAGEWPRRNKVIFPVNTWISSVSVWVNLGFEPVFVDVSAANLNVEPAHLIAAFKRDKARKIGTVFYTALLGFHNELEKCKSETQKHGARFMMDNCEASFSYYDQGHGHSGFPRSILKVATCSTSIFFSHLTMSGTEGGLVFTESDEEADWYRMARSHGLTRGMPERYKNPKVNADFDFYLMGSNYRSSNLQAYMASLDFARALEFSRTKRLPLLELLHDRLDTAKFARFANDNLDFDLSVPLAIPILCKTQDLRVRVEAYLKGKGVMCRPLIGGCLLAHTAFKGYGKMADFPVAAWSHDCGLYIGLNKDVTAEMVAELAKELNQL